jgi:hypothetical protein
LGGIDDKPHANIELGGPPGSAPAGMVARDGSEISGLVTDDDAVTPSSGLVIDDGRAVRAGVVVDGDGSAPARGAASSSFGDPMALAFADAQRIADGKLETGKVLGLIERDALDRVTDREVQDQVHRFLKKLSILEMKFSDLQKAPGKLVGYRSWLQELRGLETAPDAVQRLRAMIAAEERKVAIDELTAYVKFVLDDKVLEWAEHKKVLRKAEQYGLAAADVEAIYQRFEPFEREPQAAAERAAATGWTPHPKLATPGEVYAWNLGRFQDVMLQRFDVAVEIANQPHDKTYSLYDYLDRNREDARKELALRARAAAEDARCPALAVWYFLWTTGITALHLGGKDHRPVNRRKRQLETVDELKALVTAEWVLDDIARALEDGLLENWLFVVTQDEVLFRVASSLRQESRGVSDSQRAEFLRHAAIRVLWQAGFKGLPLRDDAKRSVIVEDLAQLTSRAEDCWEFLSWTLKHGVLAEWLDQFDPHQAARARDCAKQM